MLHWVFPRSPLSFDYLRDWQVLCLYLLLAVAVLWLGMRSLAGHGAFRKWVVVGLRLDLLLFVVLLIAGARYQREAKDLSVVAVRDVSQSVANVSLGGAGATGTPTAGVATAGVPTADVLAAGVPTAGVHQAISHYLDEEARHKRPLDRLGIISFDGAARVEALPSAVPHDRVGAIREAVDGTNVAQALQLALAALPGDTLGRLVLFWDGNATGGDLDAALNAAAARHVPIDVVPLRYHIQHEIAIDRLIAPTARNKRQSSLVKVLIRSHNPGPVRAALTLTDNGLPVDLDPAAPGVQATQTVILKPGLNAVPVALGPLPGGVHQFQASIEAKVGNGASVGAVDTLLGNNAAQAVTLVQGRSRVLYVEGGGESTERPAADALTRGGFVSKALAVLRGASSRSPTRRRPCRCKRSCATIGSGSSHLIRPRRGWRR